jgi:hypothetical protein
MGEGVRKQAFLARAKNMSEKKWFVFNGRLSFVFQAFSKKNLQTFIFVKKQ